MLEPSSYRDRNSTVFYQGQEIYRAISAEALANWERLSAAPFFHEFVARGRVVETERVAAPPLVEMGDGCAAVLRHVRIPFVSYPYEWTFGMLKDAALLHLDLMLAALDEDLILKDASAYNVQWNGAEPVFIDIPSFEPLLEGEPWIGYRQFCELFVYPLMMQAYKGVDFRAWLRGRIDGIPASTLRQLMSARDLMRPGVLMHVVTQDALQRRYSNGGGNVKGSLSKAGFNKSFISHNVRQLRKIIAGMVPASAKSEWADYARTHSYEEEDFEAKCAFVQEIAARGRWNLVWDLGCNTGTFSRIAAEHANYVVAMDGDRMAVEELYRTQKDRRDGRRILPLVVDLADPPPSQGWRGVERKSLPDRGRPDLTLCLALVHHMVISANIPMRDFIGWLASLETSLVIEFVEREDEMVQRLLCNKHDQYRDYDKDIFEACLNDHFHVEPPRVLKGGKRWIYFARRR